MANDFVEVYDDALSADECAAYIARFEQSGLAQPGATGHGVDTRKKDSVDLVLSQLPGFKDVTDRVGANLLQHMIEYVSKYRFLAMGALAVTLAHPQTGAAVELTLDSFQELATRDNLKSVLRALYRPGPVIMQKYRAGSGGYHHFHSEIFPKDPSCEQLHRVLLWMYYLNDVEEGGETEFYYQDRLVQPKAGRLVIAPAGFTHT